MINASVDELCLGDLVMDNAKDNGGFWNSRSGDYFIVIWGFEDRHIDYKDDKKFPMGRLNIKIPSYQ